MQRPYFAFGGRSNRAAASLLTLVAAQGAPEHALSETIMADVFRVDAYRANFRNQNVIVPWANI